MLRLEQVVQNLLSNAMEYSPPGSVVEAGLPAQDDQARLTVTDHRSWMGIPEREQANLFTQFYRATNVGPKRISGLGIGLYLISEIVAQRGGRVRVHSALSAGSTFSVALPRQAGERQPKQ